MTRIGARGLFYCIYGSNLKGSHDAYSRGRRSADALRLSKHAVMDPSRLSCHESHTRVSLSMREMTGLKLLCSFLQEEHICTGPGFHRNRPTSGVRTGRT